MGATIIEKILASHSERQTVKPGDIVDLGIDARVARDFGGANVVRNLQIAGLGVHDPTRTWFTFDCNPGGSDQKYAANQQKCRVFAAAHGVGVFDLPQGIGTHTAIEDGLIWPGGTLVSTDSHANIMGAIGAFGQGMGDEDIAAAWAFGKVWFKVPPSMKVTFRGTPAPECTPKDLVLAALQQLGDIGLLGFAAEFYGPAIEALDLAGRITVSSMATEMGGIIAFIPPDEHIVGLCQERARQPFKAVLADADATYARIATVDVEGLTPRVARPGHPDDVVAIDALPPTRVDSVFIGSCTNGRIEDLRAAAAILKDRTVFPGLVLKVVAATDLVWKQALDEGLWDIFSKAGALIGNAGCAGCAAGQIGQNGPGEITVSTGNRNFAGKQGQGEVYLASPATAAATAVAGVLVTEAQLRTGQVPARPARAISQKSPSAGGSTKTTRPMNFRGKAWVVEVDSIDTDMIFHNRHLAETDPTKMGQYAFGNLKGWEDFPQKVKPGDIILTGDNFGCGSSRQQAVTCFSSLGVSVLAARSFGAIWERNAINEALPILVLDWQEGQVQTGDEVEVDFVTGVLRNITRDATLQAEAPSDVQLSIYRRGGLLKG